VDNRSYQTCTCRLTRRFRRLPAGRSPEPEAVRPRTTPRVERFGQLSRVAIDQALMDHALEIAEGDASRLVLRSDGSVIIANNRKQATRARRDQRFGAGASPDSSSPPGQDQP